MAQVGQVGKRLQIIKIAISITDLETMSLQRSKLRLHKHDKLLQNILNVLDDENYAQASNLISRYLHGPNGEEASDENLAVLEEKAILMEQKVRLLKEKMAEEKRVKERELIKKYHHIEEEELINKFGLFRDKSRIESYNPVPKEEIEQIEKEIFTLENEKKKGFEIPSTDSIMASFDSIREFVPNKSNLLDVKEKRRVVAVHVDVDEPNADENDSYNFFHSADDLAIPTNAALEAVRLEQESQKEKDVDFDIEELGVPKRVDAVERFEIIDEAPQGDEYIIDDDHQNERVDEYSSYDDDNALPDEEVNEEFSPKEITSSKPNEPHEYPPISYVDQKLRNMLNQYRQIEETSECFKSEERLLYMISLRGYTEADIEKVIDDIKILKDEGKLGEASHLLLVIATTESLYAQFTLARELYKGEILYRDLPEAFTQINYLASEKYPEAVCDLAQFYEHGIGIKKDKKRALELYKQAHLLGVTRAESHMNRLESDMKGLLGKLFG